MQWLTGGHGCSCLFLLPSVTGLVGPKEGLLSVNRGADSPLDQVSVTHPFLLAELQSSGLCDLGIYLPLSGLSLPTGNSVVIMEDGLENLSLV